MSFEKEERAAIQAYDLGVRCGTYCQGGSAELEATKYPDQFSVVKYPDHLAAATARDHEISALRARVAELEGQLDRTKLPLWILREDIPMEEIRQCAKECRNTWPEEGIADDARFIDRWLAMVKR